MYIAIIYAELIRADKKTIEEVPAAIRSEVEALLRETRT